MKILITAGGTKVKIDPVRYIGNFSGGTLGSHMAKEFLVRDESVHFIGARHAVAPHIMRIDMRERPWDRPNIMNDEENFWEKFGGNYTHSEYETFADYKSVLKKGMLCFNPDITILSAAVSDYLAAPIQTKERNEPIDLEKAPKVIGYVKSWSSTFLVGFKLLSNASDKELVEAAHSQMLSAGSDMVIANSLDNIQRKLVITQGRIEAVFTVPQLVGMIYENFARSNRVSRSKTHT